MLCILKKMIDKWKCTKADIITNLACLPGLCCRRSRSSFTISKKMEYKIALISSCNSLLNDACSKTFEFLEVIKIFVDVNTLPNITGLIARMFWSFANGDYSVFWWSHCVKTKCDYGAYIQYKCTTLKIKNQQTCSSLFTFKTRHNLRLREFLRWRWKNWQALNLFILCSFTYHFS